MHYFKISRLFQDFKINISRFQDQYFKKMPRVFLKILTYSREGKISHEELRILMLKQGEKATLRTGENNSK